MNIENYFESEEFINTLRPLAQKIENNTSNGFRLIEYIINASIKYSILFRNDNELSTYGLTEFVNKVTNKMANMDIKSITNISNERELNEFVNKLYIEELLSKLNGEYIDDEIYKRSICTYIIRNLMGKNYKYHAFNSVAFNSILENGINPNINFTPQQEINIIHDMFEQKGIKNIFGWQKINCERKVSYSETTTMSYYYGINSPEWFAQFTGQNIEYNEPNKYKKDAYVLGDYASAKNNLQTLMKNHNFTKEEEEYVINFFEQKWAFYAAQKPMLAIIPSDIDYSQIWTNILFSQPYYKDDIEKIMTYCTSYGQVDCQTTEKIDVTNAKFLKLPRYAHILKELSWLNEVNQENEMETTHKSR